MFSTVLSTTFPPFSSNLKREAYTWSFPDAFFSTSFFSRVRKLTCLASTASTCYSRSAWWYKTAHPWEGKNNPQKLTDFGAEVGAGYCTSEIKAHFQFPENCRSSSSVRLLKLGVNFRCLACIQPGKYAFINIRILCKLEFWSGIIIPKITILSIKILISVSKVMIILAQMN